MARVQSQLTEWVATGLGDARIAQEFVARWPLVLGRCNDPETYQDDLNVLAYCHIHFLERYRRFYAVLEQLYRTGRLPMKATGFRVLDVGSGPAPSLYAVQDFYAQVSATLRSMNAAWIPEEEPETTCVEQSAAMQRFLHHFSERTARRGPFGARFADILSLDLQARRSASEEASRKADEADWDDPNAPWPFPPADFKHDVYIFSNVLTTEEFVEQAIPALTRLFYWLGPSQVIVIQGASNETYQRIYAKLDEIADRTKVDRVGDLETISWRYDDPSAMLIKAHYEEVWHKIETICPAIQLPPNAQDFRDVWDPEASLSGPTKFSVRVYRRHRLQPGRKWGRKASAS
jgi:hypothetical protein